MCTGKASSVQNIIKQKMQATFILGNWYPAKVSFSERMTPNVRGGRE